MRKCYVCGMTEDRIRLHWSNGDGTGETVCSGCSSALDRVKELEIACEKAKEALERLSVDFCIEDDAIALNMVEKALLKGEESSGNQ